MSALLQLIEVGKRVGIDRPRTLFDGLSLTVQAGESVALVGESGTGKSTLLNVMAGLDRADSGRVLLDGIDLATLGDDALASLRRRRVGFVFQAFHVLPYLTVAQNVALPLQLLDTGDRETVERVLAEHLYTRHFPDPDLLIRTSGEMRVSNFLLWQISYAEFVVTQTLWPDFRKAQLFEALEEYARRHRRFGGL